MSQASGPIPQRNVYARNRFTIGIESSEPADIAWLDENLQPAFGRDPATNPEHRLSSVVDAARYRRLLDRGPAPQRAPVACFGFDGHGGTCTLWSGPERLLRDDELDVFYLLHDDHHVEVLAAAARPSTRIALLRVVRECATHHLAAGGQLQFHAAALERDGQGIMIVGPTRAGKTSLLIHALGGVGSAFIANDRAVVEHLGQGAWRLSGMPTVVSIRPGTLGLLARPGLAAAGRWRARMTLAEALAAVPSGSPEPCAEGLSISPRQFCHAIAARPMQASPLQAIVFPRVDEELEGLCMKFLAPGIAAERLRTHLLHPADTVFRAAAPAGGIGAQPEAITKSVPAFECIIGRHAFSIDWPAEALGPPAGTNVPA